MSRMSKKDYFPVFGPRIMVFIILFEFTGCASLHVSAAGVGVGFSSGVRLRVIYIY